MARAKPDASLDLNNDAGPPSCQIYNPSRGYCSCTEVALLVDAPNLYFVLDRSGSMGDDGKWTTVRTVVANVITRLGPRAQFGAMMFPGRDDDCTVGVEAMSLRPGDVPAGTPGPVSKAFLQGTAIGAAGGTPTAATLRALLPKLSALGKRTFAILATDGGPNCNGAASCAAAACLPNIESYGGCAPGGPPNCCDPMYYGPLQCLDEQPTVDAVTALATAGVQTYVIGVPGSGPYAGVLDALATAGGTARSASPKYYRVDSTDTAALSTALSQIAAKISATCTYPLAKTPDDPSLVNVFVDDGPIANDPVDGWTLWGDVVTLMGKTCARVLSGDALSVRVVEGCPTVTPQ